MKATIAVVLTLVVGIGVTREARASDRSVLHRMALTSREAPKGHAVQARHDYTRSQIAAQGTWTASQLRSWGYLRGYEVEFARGLDSDAPEVLSSDVGAYRRAKGAAAALRANGDKCHVDGWSELAEQLSLGPGAHICTITGTVRGHTGRSYFVVWRIGRFKGSVTLSGVTNRFQSADAITLARRQAARMRRALR